MNYNKSIFIKRYTSFTGYIKKYGIYVGLLIAFFIYLIFTNQSSTTGYNLRQSVNQLDAINAELNNQSYTISELQKQLRQEVNININKKNIVKMEID